VWFTPLVFGLQSGGANADEAMRRFAVGAVERLVAAQAAGMSDKAKGRLGGQLEDLAAKLHRALDGSAHPFAELSRRAVLSPRETELLAVLVATEQDEQLQRLLVSLTDDRERHRVELWMLAPMLAAGPELVAPVTGLVRSALVEPLSRGAFGRQQLRLAPRVLWALVGDATPDPRLDTRLWRLSAEVDDDGWPSVVVAGKDRTRRRQAAVGVLGRGECVAVAAPRGEEGWAALVREATIGGYGVILETDEPVSPEGRRWIELASHLHWALSGTTRLPLESLPGRDWREIEAPDHDPDQEEWDFILGEGVEQQHHLTATQLDQMALAMSLTGGDAAASFRRLADARLDKLAQHTVPRAGWDDLVLSAGRKGRLRDLVNRYRAAHVVYDEWGFRASPSRGLVALFSGPSGTGKTMAAEIMAGQLGLDLYRLDLSSVVSKYIGETEKNLDELFDAASIGTTVLFFDEADSLFGKRTEMNDSKDRYANVETSYLLQRLERYDGIVVLATNYEKNIDQAFLRRVHVRIDFPMPNEPERLELWQRNLKAGAPQGGDIDLEWLAKRFDFTGASIRNAVIDAAFLAAADASPITMSHLVRGVARELHKLSRMVTEAQFGPWYEDATASTSA